MLLMIVLQLTYCVGGTTSTHWRRSVKVRSGPFHKTIGETTPLKFGENWRVKATVKCFWKIKWGEIVAFLLSIDLVIFMRAVVVGLLLLEHKPYWKLLKILQLAKKDENCVWTTLSRHLDSAGRILIVFNSHWLMGLKAEGVFSRLWRWIGSGKTTVDFHMVGKVEGNKDWLKIRVKYGKCIGPVRSS